MKRKPKRDPLSQPATKRDLQRLERKTAAGFEQLVVGLSATLNLMQKEIRREHRRKK